MKTAIANRIKTEARISARLFFLGFNHKPRNYSGRMLQIFKNEFQAELFGCCDPFHHRQGSSAY